MKTRSLLILAGGVVALGLAMTHVSQAMDGKGYGWRGHGGGWGSHDMARSPGRHHGPRGGGGFGGGPIAFFDLLDVDASGSVSLTEALRVPNQRFARLDGNQDGYLTDDEFAAESDGRRERWSDRHFDLTDADNDGRIAVGEFERAARLRFDVADIDNDGTVTLDEFHSIVREMGWFGRHGKRGSWRQGRMSVQPPAPDADLETPADAN